MSAILSRGLLLPTEEEALIEILLQLSGLELSLESEASQRLFASCDAIIVSIDAIFLVLLNFWRGSFADEVGRASNSKRIIS